MTVPFEPMIALLRADYAGAKKRREQVGADAPSLMRGAPTHQYAYLLNALEELGFEIIHKRNLPTQDGWNGEDAKATTDAARAVVDNLAIVPMVDGGVQLEFHVNGVDMEMEITPEGEPRSVFWERKT